MRTFDNRELHGRVDEVLYYIWDPIGVAEEPFARSEYESYVPKVLQLVEENDVSGPISCYLEDIASSRMGLPGNKKHSDHTAEILLQHKEAIKRGCA